jgi:carboxyl-terminal processing protease
VHNTRGHTEVLSDVDGTTFYEGPLTLLINRQSASSSEILAGAIQDYGRGLIVGDRHSFGKGTVQTVKDIAGGKFGAIKVTISKFFRPGGHSTQLRGVDSDIVLPDLVDELELGEKFYDYHLPWNTIDATDFAANDQVSPYLATLKEASQLRVDADPDFAKIREEITE